VFGTGLKFRRLETYAQLRSNRCWFLVADELSVTDSTGAAMGRDRAVLASAGGVQLGVPFDCSCATAKVGNILRVTHKAKIAIGGRKSWLTLVSISNLLWKTVATLNTLGAISLRSVLVQFVEPAKKPEALDW
jgi:hypothetical protein